MGWIRLHENSFIKVILHIKKNLEVENLYIAPITTLRIGTTVIDTLMGRFWFNVSVSLYTFSWTRYEYSYILKQLDIFWDSLLWSSMIYDISLIPYLSLFHIHKCHWWVFLGYRGMQSIVFLVQTCIMLLPLKHGISSSFHEKFYLYKLAYHISSTLIHTYKHVAGFLTTTFCLYNEY